jgi:multidrug efflux pump subunit AcrB
LLTLMLFGMPLDAVGIVKKNGIMLVDFALASQRGVAPRVGKVP